MNALLARYGGVALDITTVLLHPLDDYWNEMVLHRATFRGYLYRINGQSWSRPEVVAPWFLMSRREGVFSTAVRNQVVLHCDAYRYPDMPLADRTLAPILGTFNTTFPSCSQDSTVSSKAACPERKQPQTKPGIPGPPPRNDRRLILMDPRDGPHLPFAFLDDYGMGTWNLTETTPLLGHPRECNSPGECWQKVVLPRYHSGLLVLVKLFRHGGRLRPQGRDQLLAQRSSFFFNWLQLAGLSRTSIELALGIAPPQPHSVRTSHGGAPDRPHNRTDVPRSARKLMHPVSARDPYV